MKLVPVDLKEVPNYFSAGRGHVAYPIIKQFMETNAHVCRLDREGVGRSASSISTNLKTYIKRYEMAVRIFTRDGDVYLARTDMDEKGKIIEPSPALDISDEVIDSQV